MQTNLTPCRAPYFLTSQTLESLGDISQVISSIVKFSSKKSTIIHPFSIIEVQGIWYFIFSPLCKWYCICAFR